MHTIMLLLFVALAGLFGQVDDRPPLLCAEMVACEYLEHRVYPTPYVFQSLKVCGANCSAQYWVSDARDGRQVLAVEPVRGGAIVAVGRSIEGYPAVRVVQPHYASGDPGCCPSAFSDTTYAWDGSALVPGAVQLQPSAEFPGFDATRQQLQAEGWLLVNV
jgi:hypothetical protein